MSNGRRVRVALLGDGEQAERWAAVLEARAELLPLPEVPAGAIDALVIAPGTPDPFGQAKAALRDGLSVLYAAPFLLSPWQAGILHALSRPQGRFLRFLEPFQYQQAFSFLRRLLAGREPFWHPLYLRTLCLALPERSGRIDDLATEELALCDGLLDGTPLHVTASAAHRDEVGDICAAFITVQYSDGPVVQCTVSLAEAAKVRQLVAVTPERTVIMNVLDPVAPLRVVGSDQEVENLDLAPALHCLREEKAGDALVDEAERFLEAVAAGDRSLANSERWTRVAALWWAARQSMSFGGPVEVPATPLRSGQTTPPPLRVIEGGGASLRSSRQRPPLTVVSR